MIAIKRVYEPAGPEDGQRFLVDRLWARGLTKADVQAVAWLKDVAPSTALRQWFHSKPDQWEEFQDRYRAELCQEPPGLAILRAAAAAGKVTLLYSAKNESRNHAVVLKAFLEQR